MEIHWYGTDGFEPGERTAVEDRLQRLADGHHDLIDLRIMGHASGHHRHGDREVRITCQARGEELVVGRTADELGLAIHDALDAFERSVRRMREKRNDHRRSTQAEDGS